MLLGGRVCVVAGVGAGLGREVALALAGRTAEAIEHTQRALSDRQQLGDEIDTFAVATFVVSQILALNELYEAAEQAGYLRGLRSAVGSLEHAELASIVEELNRDPRDLEPALAAPVLD